MRKDDRDHSSLSATNGRVDEEILSDAWSAVAILSCAVSLTAYLLYSKSVTAYGEMYYAIAQKLFAVIAH